MCWWWWKVFIIKYTRFCHFSVVSRKIYFPLCQGELWINILFDVAWLSMNSFVFCIFQYLWLWILYIIDWTFLIYILKNTSLMQFHWTLHGFTFYLCNMTNLQVFLNNNWNLLLVYQVFEILPNWITLNAGRCLLLDFTI